MKHKLRAAVVEKDGIEFAVVMAENYVLDNRQESIKAIQMCAPVFPGKPVILMVQDLMGTAHYFGRPDIIDIMSRISLKEVSFKDYEFPD